MYAPNVISIVAVIAATTHIDATVVHTDSLRSIIVYSINPPAAMRLIIEPTIEIMPP